MIVETIIDYHQPSYRLNGALCKSHSKASLSTLFIAVFSLLYFLYGDDVNARCILYLASINEMPAPDAVFVFIKISHKMFYNRFRVIRV